MTKVSAEDGISDVALKKICDKHRIRLPGRGYWAKKATGLKARQALFLTVADPADNRIVKYGSPDENLPKAHI